MSAIITVPDQQIEKTRTLRQFADMRLDDATIANKIQNYPPEIIEPVSWLAAFMREQCSGRNDLLVDRVRKVGYETPTQNQVVYE